MMPYYFPRPPRRRKLRAAPMPVWREAPGRVRRLPVNELANRALRDERVMLLVLDTLLTLELQQ